MTNTVYCGCSDSAFETPCCTCELCVASVPRETIEPDTAAPDTAAEVEGVETSTLGLDVVPLSSTFQISFIALAPDTTTPAAAPAPHAGPTIGMLAIDVNAAIAPCMVSTATCADATPLAAFEPSLNKL